MAKLHTAANGFAQIADMSGPEARAHAHHLVFRHGFLRWGHTIAPPGNEAIYPDFVRGRVRINAGWDCWSDYYLLATDARSDEFLRGFYERHVRKEAEAV